MKHVVHLSHLVVLLAALVLSACGGSAAPAPTLSTSGLVATQSAMIDKGRERPQIGQTAPDFRYTMADGTEQRLSGLRGKRVILNFWATWCTPCKHEMPVLQGVATEQADSLVVLGINRLESAEAIGRFADEMGLTFPLVTNEDGDITERYGARQLPMTYFIDSNGTISALVLGPIDAETIAKHLAAMS